MLKKWAIHLAAHSAVPLLASNAPLHACRENCVSEMRRHPAVKSELKRTGVR